MSDVEAIADLIAERDRLRAELEDLRREAQAESAFLKERMARVRLELQREMQEQGWVPPNAEVSGAGTASAALMGSASGETNEH